MICEYEECNNQFEPKTHNQKYCSDECCRTATNLKIKEKYYEKKARLSGKKRFCKKCNAELSMYNESYFCSKCSADKVAQERKMLLEMIKNVTI